MTHILYSRDKSSQREFFSRGYLEKHMGSNICIEMAAKRNTIFTKVELKAELMEDCTVEEVRNLGLDMQVSNEDE